MIMTAKDLLDHNPHPTLNEVREALAQNLCRCGTTAGSPARLRGRRKT